MNNTPKCPYCGDRMELQIVPPMELQIAPSEFGKETYSVWYQCVACDSTSSQLEIPVDSTQSQIEAKALASVMRRAEPKNRVLTLDEIREMEDNSQFNWVLIWVESQSKINTKEYCLVQSCIQYIVDNEFSFVYPAWEGNDLFRAEVYKKTWRCWLRRPTEKERETVPWEK